MEQLRRCTPWREHNLEHYVWRTPWREHNLEQLRMVLLLEWPAAQGQAVNIDGVRPLVRRQVGDFDVLTKY